MRLKDPTIVLSNGDEVTIKQPETREGKPAHFETMFALTRVIVTAVFHHFETKERNITRAQTKAAAECGYSDTSGVRRIIG